MESFKQVVKRKTVAISITLEKTPFISSPPKVHKGQPLRCSNYSKNFVIIPTSYCATLRASIILTTPSSLTSPFSCPYKEFAIIKKPSKRMAAERVVSNQKNVLYHVNKKVLRLK